VNWRAKNGLLVLAYSVVQFAMGSALSAVLLTFAVFGLSIGLRGIWRTRLHFVPSSIHYSTAWWPPLSLLMVILAFACTGYSDLALPGTVLLILAASNWAVWLWGSVTEGQYIRFAGLRIAVVAAALVLAGGWMPLVFSGVSQTAMAYLLSGPQSGRARINLLGKFSGKPAFGPKTCILNINALGGDDVSLIQERLTKLGGDSACSVKLLGADCTLKQINAAFMAARNDLQANDRFILYMRGHGARNGSGSIRMDDGEITSQNLAGLLSKLPNTHCLVIIDSCFAGKFIAPLRGCNAVVVTASDDRNVSYRSGLTRFWEALGDPQADCDRNGVVTVNEAFWTAFRSMLNQTEAIRQKGLAEGDPQSRTLLADSGFQTPQLEAVGEGDKNEFGVPVLDSAVPTSGASP
jgi:hypothetical protein